jgi:hypothetical protein
MHRFLTHPRPLSALIKQAVHVEFYREELIKHKRCLQTQREYYSEGAVNSAEDALNRLLGELDRVCRQKDADLVLGHLLRQFDVVTGLSGWTDPRKVN